MRTKKILGYVLLVILLMVISSAPETLRTLVKEHRSLSHAWIMFLPSTTMYILSIYINNKWLINEILLESKFGKYIFTVFLLSFTASFMSVGIDSILKIHFDFPNRFSNGLLLGIIQETCSSSFFLCLLLVSMAFIKLYNVWKCDMEEERIISENLKTYIISVRECLNPTIIFAEMNKISEAISENYEKAAELIDNFSIYLRRQLSNLPTPPVLKETTCKNTIFSFPIYFLISRKYSISRHIIFLFILCLVSYIAFADEHPGAPLDSTTNSLVLFVFFVLVFHIIRFCFFRRYEKTQNIRKFMRSIAIFSFIITVPIIITVLVTLAYEINNDGILVKFIEVMVLFSGLVGVYLYVIGIGGILFFQNWIRIQRNLILLHNETLRQEYISLRKQINPHFLFNVLNNIGISAIDDPGLASELLRNLTKLLEYQFMDSMREITVIKDEVVFLESYLSLEKSRHEHLDYEISLSENVKDTQVPTLLFIPIIENAVKYFVPVKCDRSVKIDIKKIGKCLIFKCQNPFDQNRVKNMSHHGIGHDNLRRRLDLIYDGNAKIVTKQTISTYSVTLIINLQDQSL